VKALRLVVFLLAATAALPQSQSPPSIPGFGADGAREQLALEKKFDAAINRDNLREWLKRMSAHPHHLGSPYGKEVAEFIASQFRSWGYETKIETFYPLFPTPKQRLVEVTAPEKYTLKLEEPVIPEDATSGVDRAAQLPSFHAYSIDGDVTGELVYVNYGLPKDYEWLAEHGIDVRGKIVLARYGASWRGIKPKVAAEHGALGCIIYSDPRDDGYFQGDVYPKGAWRPDSGAQRGSVMDLPTYPGDPLTPFVGATEYVDNPDYQKAQTLTKIPVLPISYGDAVELIKRLGGPVAPEPWRGALPITYHAGPGPATVHLKLAFNWKLAPAYDVIARMPGSELPGEWILRGNHHDGWVFGAADPLSGLVTLMEEARAVAELAKTGWRPKRTMIYAAWDGEEPALLGSTEWAETHADELRQHAAVYVNSDGNGRGFLYAGGSQTLEGLINSVARDVTDPEKKVSVLERNRAFRLVNGTPEAKKIARDHTEMPLAPLGSGSDYSPFLQHLGIASLNLGYGGEDQDAGVYHSIYDSFDHFTKFEDPDFQYSMTMVQTGGRTTLRLANAEILPVRFDPLVRAIETYSSEVIKLADTMRDETRESNRMLADKSFDLAADPAHKYVAPEAKEPVPYLNFAPLQNAVAKLADAARKFDEAQSDAGKQHLAVSQREALDQALMATERALIRKEGLPRRPWYRHQIYAPGYYTGYGVKTLPGVREAIEERHWTEASEQIPKLAETLDALTAQVDHATHIVRGEK
jgi:N-acetylated-alpha-linked acidic dipeptidase